jgi:hypothetical protein
VAHDLILRIAELKRSLRPYVRMVCSAKFFTLVGKELDLDT